MTPRRWPSAASRSPSCRPPRPSTICSRIEPDGVFFSNGPGDPATADHEVAAAKRCAGARAAVLRDLLRPPVVWPRARLRHLQARYGHRGINQPVKDLHHRQGRDHGAQPWFRGRRADRRHVRPPFGPRPVCHVCLNDDVVEGLALLRAAGVQRAVPPRGRAGPHDAGYLFDRFVDLMTAEGRPAMPERDRHRARCSSSAPGPIVIGQACEFDYSGTQACRVSARRAAGHPGQLQPGHDHDRPRVRRRDVHRADHAEFVEKVIARERPDALLATLGGQTALNAAIALDEAGVLEKYGVELIGASIERDRDGGESRVVQGRSSRRCPRSGARSGQVRHLPHDRGTPRRRSKDSAAIPSSYARRSRWAAPAPAWRMTRPTCTGSLARLGAEPDHPAVLGAAVHRCHGERQGRGGGRRSSRCYPSSGAPTASWPCAPRRDEDPPVSAERRRRGDPGVR